MAERRHRHRVVGRAVVVDGEELLVELKRQLYRDSGAYRKEFCEFFFGSIHDIGDPPPLTAASPGGRRGGRSRNPSLEERVRRSMGRASLVTRCKALASPCTELRGNLNGGI